jgi:N-methylhydantoinase B
VAGGQSGRGGRAVINPGTDRERIVDALSDGTVLQKGDVFRIETVGGGGWGDPRARDPDRVRADVLGGFVSLASAEADYGVVLFGPEAEINGPATAALRNRPAADAAGPALAS